MNLREMLKGHEGLELKPYTDSVGKLSIGFGRNLQDVGISAAEAEFLLDNDIADAIRRTKQAFPWFDTLDPVRQDVIVMMAFNVGVAKLGDFIKMIQAIKNGDFYLASQEMMDSAWARQVGSRALVLSRMMFSAKYPDSNNHGDPGAGNV